MEEKTQLAIIRAFKNAFTKREKELIASVSADMTLGDRLTLPVEGEKAGSITMTAPKEKVIVTVFDPDAAIPFFKEHNIAFTVELPSGIYGKSGLLEIVGNQLVTRDGEVVEGVMVERDYGKPYPTVKGCEPEKVLPLLSNELLLEALGDVRRLEE